MPWEAGALDGEPTVVVRHGGARVEVAHTGATVLRWSVAVPGGGTAELGAGYLSAAQLERNLEGAFAVMAPFANRVRDGQYTFAGQEHDLLPSMHPLDTEVIHGLVRRARWEVLGVEEDDDATHLTLRTSIAPDDHPGYPFALDLQATYTVRGDTLGLALRVTNTGTQAAPVVVGWHPYLTLPGHASIDGLEIRVPARTRVLVDDALIPLAGDRAYAEYDGGGWQSLDGVAMDSSLLLEPADGVVSSWVRSPVTGHAIEVRQRYEQAPVLHVFTADTLPGRERAVLALEPVGGIADAFNRPEWGERVRLAPGETRELDVALVHRSDA